MTDSILGDLRSRYTCKKYDVTKKIPEPDLAILYESMRLSASSINAQPWKFIVIESPEAKARMSSTFANKFQFNEPHIHTASHIILFAHNPQYTRANYGQVVDKGIVDKRINPADREAAFAGFAFAQLNTDENGDTSNWTKAQVYLALGNTLHTLARLKIDSTTMEGVDADLISHVFKEELDGYRCEVALAIGYHHPDEDYNASLPKSRLNLESIMTKI